MGYIIGVSTSEAYSANDNNIQGKGFGVLDSYISANGSRYVHVLSSDTIAQFDVIAITSAGVASRLTTVNAIAANRIAVAQATLSSGYFGWGQILGPTSINALSTCSAGVALYATGTAGAIDDGPTTNTKIAGIQLAANITAAAVSAAVLVTEPFAQL